MNSILKRTQEKLNNKNVYITEKDDVYYLTRFHSSNLSLFFVNEKWFALTDQRYFENATKSITHMEVLDIQDPSWVSKVFDGINEIYVDSKNTTVEKFDRITKLWGEKTGVKVIAEDFPLIRYGYTGDDIISMEESSLLNDELIMKAISIAKVGMTEKEFEAEILKMIIDHPKAEGVSFDPIIASGPSGSSPHWSPSDRVMQANEMVTLDMGVFYKGFASDMTRTFVIEGEISEEEQLIWDTVKKAMETSIEMIKPGMLGKDIHANAANIIEEAGYGKYFNHGLGHSVGINVHEDPRLSPMGNSPLEAGMIVTVEPGIYIPGKYGVRLEQSVLVTEDGHKVLNHAPVKLYN